jgi:hypothetical protein
MRFQICSNKGDTPIPRGDNSKRVKIHFLRIFFSRTRNIIKSNLQNQLAKINQTWYKLSFGEENLNKGQGPFQRGIIIEM